MPIEEHTDIDNNQQLLLYSMRSDEVQEIMGRMPSWIIRWGITLIGIIIISLLIGAYFFKYPDVIHARVVITSANPPVKIIARNNLPIQDLLVHNGDIVHKNQILCVLANAANYKDVESIAHITQALDTTFNLSRMVPDIQLPQGVQLGALQAEYVTLYQAISNYLFFLSRNNYLSKVDQFKIQLNYHQKLIRELNNKSQRLQEQSATQRQRKDSSLMADNITLKAKYDDSKKKLDSQRINTEEIKSSIIQEKLQQSNLRVQMSDTRLQWQTDKNNLEQQIKEAATSFNGSYSQWAQNYLLRTPVAGKITFFSFWQAHQFVRAGKGVMMVTPPIQKFVARGQVAVLDAGRIEPGQKVTIKLTAYPYQEYGSIAGTVVNRSLVAMDTIFSIDIKLDNGLHTNAGKIIPLDPQMTGVGEIRTDDKSILQRLFDKVYGKN